MELELPISVKLAGVTFGDCQRSIRLYAHHYSRFRMEREPLNEYDPNAVSVKANGQHIGYLPKDVAAEIAPVMDEYPGLLKVKFVRRNISGEVIKKHGKVVRGITVKIYENGGNDEQEFTG